MTKIVKIEFDVDSVIPLNTPRPTVTVGQLIDLVNAIYENGVIEYWEESYGNPKTAPLTIDGFEHGYTYKFDVEIDNVKHEVNVETIRKGIERLLSGKVQVANRIIRDIQDNLTEGGINAVGSDTQDCIIQAGLFGEIVYG